MALYARRPSLMPNGLGVTGCHQRSTPGWPLDQRRVQGSTPLKKTKGRPHVAALFLHFRKCKVPLFAAANSVFAALGKTFPIEQIGLGKF
jgi:hypothetical protein